MSDLSDYPAFLRDTPVYGANEVNQQVATQARRRGPKNGKEPEIDPEEIILQQALAANAALVSKAGPYSHVGQQALKAAPQDTPPRKETQVFAPPPPSPPRQAQAPAHRPSPQSESYGDPEPIGDTDQIPPNHFLLRSLSGDIFLRPAGFQDETHFLVLYFDGDTLVFRPGLSTRFLGAVDSPSGERSHYGLYFSGIAFLIPDVNKTALIFHKAAS